MTEEWTHTHACTHTHSHSYVHTHTHSDVMSLPMLKQHVYVALEPQQSGEGGGGKGMEAVEARLNVMQVVFLSIQLSPSLDRDILLKGQQIFQSLFNRHFTDKLEVSTQNVGRTPVVHI